MAVVRNFFTAVAATLVVALPLSAQGVGSIHGRIVDSTSQTPLTSVVVTVEGTALGALSRQDGTFDIAGVAAGAQSVRVRRIGFHTKSQAVTVTADGTANVEFALSPQAAVLTEMVVTGYGAQRRESITGAVSNLQADEANVGVITNATKLMQGRVSGVEIVQNNGEPGAGSQIRVRGGTSISASNDPLYVIDGVAVMNDASVPNAPGVAGNEALARSPMNTLNPSDIESITVLKDASATAIYGSRAANGVILIQTKKGTANGASMEYDTYYGMSRRAGSIGLANGAQYKAFIQGVVNATPDSLPAAALSSLGTANTDWEQELSQTGFAMNQNVAFSGGTPVTQYRASMNYFDQQGVVLNSGLRRYQGRLNATHNAINGRLRLNVNLMASRVNNTYTPTTENGGGFQGGVFTNMVSFNPTNPVYNPDGTFYEIGTGAQGIRNPVGLADQLTDVAPESRMLGNFTAVLGLMDNLTAQTTLGGDNTNSVRQLFVPQASPVAAPNGIAAQRQQTLETQTFQQLLTYTPHIASNQEFEVVGGYEYSKDKNTGFGAQMQGFVSDAYGVNNLGGGTASLSPIPYSYLTDSKLASFFGRANWGYAGKYFLTASIRDDGSSRLAEGHKWASFPGIAASWRMSEENFMRNRPLSLSMLALRLGWGKQGNQAVDPYQTQLLLRSDAGAVYPFGGVPTLGLAAAQVGNPNLKWETATQTNLGVDFGFMNDRITGGMDLYQKNTHDLLLKVNVPQPAVVTQQIENVGSVQNRGFEANLDAQLWSSGNRSLSGGLVMSVERNKVTDLGDTTAACQSNDGSVWTTYLAAKCTYYQSGFVNGQGQSNQWSEAVMKGQPLGTFVAPNFLGVVTDVNSPLHGQQTFSCVASSAGCVNGVTTNPAEADRIIVGSANPSFVLGLRNNGTWGSFDASWLWRGEFGGKVFNNTRLVYETKSNAKQNRNMLAAAIDDPDNISEPAKFSTRWIESRTFTRLQNVTVGYSLPASLTRGHSTRMFVSADNLVLFSGYQGYDPEVFTNLGLASRGIDYLNYPPTRTFTIGAHTNF
jgi:TonB-linked SusC/RagA family outer membrane protein